MQTDILSRRLRHAPPQPRDSRISVTADDLAIFQSINRHGPLPSTYLHEYIKAKSFAAFQHRLTKLYNGSRWTPPLLSRPQQQFQSFNARCQPLVYDLTEISQRLLTDLGTALIRRTDPFVHRLMGACFGASMELACREAGLRYISRSEVLAKKGASLGIPVRDSVLIPDDLFGLQYPDRSYRFFAIEFDRNSETIDGHSASAFSPKLKAYAEIADRGLYLSHWGVPSMMVLTVTTSEVRIDSLLKLARDRWANRAKRFLFKANAAFGTCWSIPQLSTDFLTLPWENVDGRFWLSEVQR